MPPPINKNFVILLGGPGVYKGCDPAHDQTWSNYLVPIQVATKNRLLNKEPYETIHWFVYEPAYKDRWKDDSANPPVNPALAKNRKAKADRVISQGSSSYMSRIEKIAADLGIKVKKIYTPQEFWTGLAAFPDNSISRVWYIGHASGTGLMLKLIHNSSVSLRQPLLIPNKFQKRLDSGRYLWQTLSHGQHSETPRAGASGSRH